MRFSQRKGIKPAQKKLQFDDIDIELRSRLWNLLTLYLWNRYHHIVSGSNVKSYSVEGSNLGTFVWFCWHDFFKLSVDTIPYQFNDALRYINERFFKFTYDEVFDFIEFILESTKSHAELEAYLKGFTGACNNLLTEENSAYRIVENQFVQITSEEEIKAIEEAITDSVLFPGVKTHLSSALEHLSDRKNPDYRNSIKESLSAVESACQTITGDKNATLGQALKLLEKHQTIHGALKNGFSSIYGYANDADGIRHAHALDDEPNITFVDAKFMLVACSAFVNYLTGKVAELNIQLPQST